MSAGWPPRWVFKKSQNLFGTCYGESQFRTYYYEINRVRILVQMGPKLTETLFSDIRSTKHGRLTLVPSSYKKHKTMCIQVLDSLGSGIIREDITATVIH